MIRKIKEYNRPMEKCFERSDGEEEYSVSAVDVDLLNCMDHQDKREERDANEGMPSIVNIRNEVTP